MVETKPGGDGVVAADAAMKSAPDGYTLFYATNTVSLVGYFGFFLFTHRAYRPSRSPS